MSTITTAYLFFTQNVSLDSFDNVRNMARAYETSSNFELNLRTQQHLAFGRESTILLIFFLCSPFTNGVGAFNYLVKVFFLRYVFIVVDCCWLLLIRLVFCEWCVYFGVCQFFTVVVRIQTSHADKMSMCV